MMEGKGRVEYPIPGILIFQIAIIILVAPPPPKNGTSGQFLETYMLVRPCT